MRIDQTANDNARIMMSVMAVSHLLHRSIISSLSLPFVLIWHSRIRGNVDILFQSAMKRTTLL